MEEDLMSPEWEQSDGRTVDDILERWRTLGGIVKQPKRRFRFTANLSQRSELAAMRRSNQEKLRIATLVSKAALQFIQGIPGEYKPPDEVKQAGFGIDADKLSSLISSRNLRELKFFGVEGIARHLNVSLDKGISLIERPPLSVRQKVFGLNVYDNNPGRSLWSFARNAMDDFTFMVLGFSAILSIVIGNALEGWPRGSYNGLGIILCISLLVMIIAVSDYRQYLQSQDLNEQKNSFVLVTRGGYREKLPVCDLVVGDVVHLFTGEQVPADGIYISGYNLLVDESTITGESEPVNVNQDNPFLLAGTKVQDGSGKMLVGSVGMRTDWGRQMETLNQTVEDETPLQVELNSIATLMGKISLIFSLLTFLVQTAGLIAGKTLHNEFPESSSNVSLTLLNNVAKGVSVFVAGVPERVPLALTLSLAFAATKLMKKKALLKHLSSCENMASVSSICTDKTGTLTINHMVVDRLFFCNEVISSKDAANLLKSAEHKLVLDILLQSIFLNTCSEVVHGKDGKKTIFGSPTESALLEFALPIMGHGADRYQQFRILQERSFSSLTKRRSVLVACPEGGKRAFCTGAAESVLHSCDKIISSNGLVYLSQENRKNVVDIINSFCHRALRTLCLGFKDVEDPDECGLPDDGFTLIAIVGISDPLRPEVKDAVRMCLGAGITIRMVTGDNINTAKAIAKECGILKADGLAIEGSTLRALRLDEFKELIPKIQVVARCSPKDKCTVVTQLKSSFKEVVAVVGDGTNDAPALNAADVGLAMGVSGTEFAKENADIVILDDNFATIVDVVRWGRTVHMNIQKFMQFQLTFNAVALSINFLSACNSGFAPLTAVQLLWVNLIMGASDALALATEPPNGLMKRPPFRKGGRFITNAMWRNIVGQSIYQLLVLGVLSFDGKHLLRLEGPNAAETLDTLIFNTFVFCQVFNEINNRDVEKINVFSGTCSSSTFTAIMISTVTFQVIFVEVLGSFTRTVALSWQLWLLSIVIASVSMLVAVVLKCIPVE